MFELNYVGMPKNSGTKHLKIVVDDKIPYIREALTSLTSNVIYKEGRSITSNDVHDADALIVRTRTRCDSALLAGSSVQIVVTATIGYDHLDTAWLEQAGIKWTNCPGCNASSVAQWVRESLLTITGIHLANMTLGIVGYGHVGHQVAKAMRPYVKEIIIDDPPLAETSNDIEGITDLVDLKGKADIITFHTPLTKDGRHPTWHLADKRFFSTLARPIILINAARGGVVDEKALLNAMENGVVTHALIDTWENEPDINAELLHRAVIATPHIAGYSADGKANASRMAVEAVARHFGMQADTSSIVPPPSTTKYDPRTDTAQLVQNPEHFEWLRGNYPVRRE